MLTFRRTFFAVAFALAACSPAQPQPKPVDLGLGAVLPDAGARAGAFASPSRWTLTPAPSEANASLVVEGGTLSVGQGGERWVQHADGAFDAASDLAPEPLVAIGVGGGGYRFVGKSGTVYEAPSALAPLRRAGEPVVGARAVALGERAALAIDAGGEFVRSMDGGRAWANVPVGPRDGVLVQLAASGREAVAIAAPQRLFASSDDGATWKPISSPGFAVARLRVVGGAIVASTFLHGEREYDPARTAFVERGRPARGSRPAAALRTALDGRNAVLVEADPQHRTHRVAVFELGARPSLKKLDALDGCVDVHAAMRGTVVALACDAILAADGTVDKTPGPVWRAVRGRPAASLADGGRSTGMVTKVFRSEDGGKTFAEDASLEGGQPDDEAAIALGDGGWVFLGRRCAPSSSGRACTPAHVRPATGAPWVAVPEGDDAPRQQEFAGSVTEKAVYSIGWHDGDTVLYRWPPGAVSGESMASLATSAARSVSLSVDDTGTVRGFVYASAGSAFEVQGTKFTSLALPDVQATSGAFAGKLGLVRSSRGPNGGTLLETTDAGKTWHSALAPQPIAVLRCSTDGCLTSRGLRAGWDGRAAAPTVANRPLYAKPIQCKPTGAWTALGGGQLPGAANADMGGARWVLPVRDRPGAVALVTSKWADSAVATTRTSLIGPAPQPPAYGAATTMHVQPNGVVVLRYSYARARTGLGRYNPVDMHAVWQRAANGKIAKVGPIKLDPFRVAHDPQFGAIDTPAFGDGAAVLSLGPRGLWFRAPGISDRAILHHFRDDGRVEKTRISGTQDENALVVADDGARALFATGNEGEWTVWSPADGKETRFGVLGGLNDDEAHVDVLDFGGKPVFPGTLRSAQAHAWTIPVGLGPELAAATAVPTQLALGDVPRACAPGVADPKSQRVVLPWVRGSRHPLTIDVDGTPHVLATGSLASRLVASVACAAALEAAEVEPIEVNEDSLQRDKYSALVFPGDPAGSLLFKVHGPDWPDTVSVRPISCSFEPGPLPESLATAEGFSE